MEKTNEASSLPNCSNCPIRKPAERLCITPGGKHPPNCPTAMYAGIADDMLARYKTPEVLPLALQSAKAEIAGYKPFNGGVRPMHPRIVEIVDFAQRLGFTKLGLIFCFGLRDEAKIVGEIFEKNGFEVASVVCKVGHLPKDEIGLEPDEQLNPYARESMCNPIMQAEIMNDTGVELNVLLGLCVGHDTMALQNLKAPVTILAVKDRTSGHNPLSCIYHYHTFGAYLKRELFPERKK